MKLKVKFKPGSILGRETMVFVEDEKGKHMIPFSKLKVEADAENLLTIKFEIVMPFVDEENCFVKDLFKTK